MFIDIVILVCVLSGVDAKIGSKCKDFARGNAGERENREQGGGDSRGVVRLQYNLTPSLTAGF